MRTFPFGLFVFAMGRSKLNRSYQEKLELKNQTWKRYQYNRSRAQFVSDCLLLTATEQHRKATVFFEQLKDKYPQKRDVRKTSEFRDWQRKQLRPVDNESTPRTDQTPVESRAQDNTRVEKEMVLHIPLIPTPAKAKEIPAVPDIQQTQEDLNMFDEIPSAVMDELMAEIHADPILKEIMNDFNFNEEVLDEGTVPENVWQELDMGLDIEIDDRLEQEINSIVHF